MSSRFAEKMQDRKVRKDTRILGDFTEIFCAGNHAERARVPLVSDAAGLGVYGRKPPVVCEECAEHLRYAEKRRAFCPKDPKPFCAHCDTHCYKSDEREFQRTMMRYAGPRSAIHGHAIDGIRHAIASRRHEAALKRASGPEDH